MLRMHVFCTLRVNPEAGNQRFPGNLPCDASAESAVERIIRPAQAAGPASSGILRAIKGSALADPRSCRKAQQALDCLPGFVFW